MKFTTSNKAFILILMVIYFETICVINTTKMCSLNKKGEISSNLKRKNKKNSNISNFSKIKKSRSQLTKKRKSLTKWDYKEAFQKIASLTQSVGNKTRSLINGISGSAKNMANYFKPLSYIIKWIWEKTKKLVGFYEKKEKSFKTVKGYIRSPVTSVLNHLKQTFKELKNKKEEVEKIEQELQNPEVGKVGEINTAAVDDIFNTIKENKEITVKNEKGEEVKTKFLNYLYDSFLESLLEELNPFDFYSNAFDDDPNNLITEEASKEETSSSDSSEKKSNKKSEIEGGLEILHKKVAKESFNQCKRMPKVAISVSILIRTALEVMKKYGEHLNNIIHTLDSTDDPAEIASDTSQSTSPGQENRISYENLFSSIKVFIVDFGSIFLKLFIVLFNAFKDCYTHYSKELAKNLKDQSGQFIKSLALAIIDKGVGSLVFLSQIRGLFSTFLSIFSALKITKNTTDNKDYSQAGDTVGSYLAFFLMSGLDGVLGLLNIDGITYLTNTLFNAYRVLYETFKNNQENVSKDDEEDTTDLPEESKASNIPHTLTQQLNEKIKQSENYFTPSNPRTDRASIKPIANTITGNDQISEENFADEKIVIEEINKLPITQKDGKSVVNMGKFTFNFKGLVNQDNEDNYNEDQFQQLLNNIIRKGRVEFKQ